MDVPGGPVRAANRGKQVSECTLTADSSERFFQECGGGVRTGGADGQGTTKDF